MRRALRVIPRLDIKGPNLVKGVHLEGLRVLGKPWSFARAYYRGGADELIYIDAVASLYGRNSLLEIVRKTAENIFIPLTVGGGVRSVHDMRDLLCAGADKIAINTGAVNNPDLITQGAALFGSQCVVGSIQAKLINGKYFVFTDNGREATEREVVPWALRLVELGAGEILVTSIDREGTAAGYDLDLIAELADVLTVPLIVGGGCGRIDHMLEAAKNAGVDAVCASSLFHYQFLKSAQEDESFAEEGNVEFLKSHRGEREFMTSRLLPADIKQVKFSLKANGVSCRETAG